ncbi:flavin reductase family protein [Nocardioides caldifontis]|uniref:flavin reductase family protein n=1 Tax=Nocardioides caldifontis TaxID=2588938 RepID=UPI0011DF2A70|nr:flavin reductase family protein [Nocardioides caldifontis]
MTIHAEHPFRNPEDDPVRQLRGRLGGAVTLLTSGAEHERAGLTVTSLVVAAGEPAYVLALVDPDSDLADAVEETGRAVLQLLSWQHRDLAEVFAGLAPAPGGAFRHAPFEETAWGPRLATATTWAGLVLEDAREVGWSREVRLRLDHVEVGADDDPLFHRRGRYRRAPGAG